MQFKSMKFDIHGVILEFKADNEELGAVIEDFLSLHKCEEDKPSDIVFSFRKYDPERPELFQQFKTPEGAYWFFNYGGESGFLKDGIYYYISYGSPFTFYPEKLLVEAAITPMLIENPRIFTHGILTIIMMETLRYKGLYFIHGGSIMSPEGKSLMVTGDSGAGKTTLTVALVNNGWSWLTDDSILLKRVDGKVVMLPFKRPFHVPPALSAKIEALNFLADQPAYFPNNPKRALPAEKIYGDLRLSSVKQPDVILYTSIGDCAQSRVERLGSLDSLNLMVRNSPYVMFSQAPSKAHLEALKCVVEGAACYNLTAGRDMLDDPVKTAANLVRNL